MENTAPVITTVKPFSSGAYPSLGQSFGLLGYTILFTIILYFPLFSLLGQWDHFHIIETLVYIGSIVLVIVLANRKRKSSYFSLRAIPVAIYFLIILFVPAFSVVVEPVINLVPVTDWAKKLFEDMFPSSFLSIALVVAAAPILEEYLFRGIILRGFLRRYSPWKAILLSSFLFGLIHLNPWQFIPAFFSGMMLGWLYWRSGSLLPCIFLHFVNNALAAFFGSLAKDSFTTTLYQTLNDPVLYTGIFAGASLLLVMSIFFIGKILKSQTININL